MRRGPTAGALAGAMMTFFVGSAVAAEPITPAVSAERKIGVAGRQQMLIELMANSACYADLDIRRDYHNGKMGLAHWLFGRALKDLRRGERLQKILPENNADILAGLDRVDALWKVYGKEITAWQSGKSQNLLTLQKIFAFSIPTQKKMNAVTALIIAHYGGQMSSKQDFVRARNEADHVRMLGVRASKEFCLIANGHEAEKNIKSLAETAKEFGKSLKHLIEGNAERGIPSPPVGIIAEQLTLVDAKWQTLSASLRRAADQNADLLDLIEPVDQTSIEILQELNKVIELYEALLKS